MTFLFITQNFLRDDIFIGDEKFHRIENLSNNLLLSKYKVFRQSSVFISVCKYTKYINLFRGFLGFPPSLSINKKDVKGIDVDGSWPNARDSSIHYTSIEGACIEDAGTKGAYFKDADTIDTYSRNTCTRGVYNKGICIKGTCITGFCARSL